MVIWKQLLILACTPTVHRQCLLLLSSPHSSYLNCKPYAVSAISMTSLDSRNALWDWMGLSISSTIFQVVRPWCLIFTSTWANLFWSTTLHTMLSIHLMQIDFNFCHRLRIDNGCSFRRGSDIFLITLPKACEPSLVLANAWSINFFTLSKPFFERWIQSVNASGTCKN